MQWSFCVEYCLCAWEVLWIFSDDYQLLSILTVECQSDMRDELTRKVMYGHDRSLFGVSAQEGKERVIHCRIINSCPGTRHEDVPVE